MSVKFQYKTIFPKTTDFPENSYASYYERILNELGAEGWQMVASGENRFHYYWVLMREVQK